ncbi:hypothetical protein [uncultured Imperialibacter sp.]|uniref:hypothetical protein n=1 Tax=uncultured Imperialibacter sp. TaxID=1672639 RepID=UPI0030DCB376|tara:strand:+ start:4177 stop:5121 length:945 start_codon:yes stop_codon:yes gene_type:complete
MEFQSKEEKKNERIGTAVSLGVHALLLLIFAFLLAWKEPNPPIPEYGIELNFGLDSQGSGAVQPESTVEQSESTSDAEEVNEDVPEETQTEETEPVEDTAEPEVVEESTNAPEEAVVTQNVASPDVRKEEPVKTPVTTPKKEEEKPKEVKKETKPVVAETKSTPVETKKEPTEKSAEKPSGGVSSDKVVASNSQGDNTAATGDKGNKEGTVDARALYGTPGGGGGAALDMAGWAWEEIPKPNDTSNESGRIVFEITVDENGEVIGIKTLERGVSAAVEAVYRREVEGLYFKRNPPNSPAPPRSTGRITFIIKSR